MDAFRGQFYVTKAESNNFPPGQAGGEQIFLDIVADGTHWFLLTVLPALVADAANDLRKTILEPRTLGRARDTQKSCALLRLWAGSPRFFFMTEVTEEEFQKRLQAAKMLVEAAPEDGLGHSTDHERTSFCWDSRNDGWTPSNRAVEGDFCPPDAG